MRDVIIGQSAVRAPVEGIEGNGAVVRAFIDVLAKRVAHIHRETLGKTTIRGELQGVVTGVAATCLVLDAAVEGRIETARVGRAGTAVNGRVHFTADKNVASDGAYVGGGGHPASKLPLDIDV